MNGLGKTQRQHRIARMLETNAVTSQTQLVELLEADGVRATQATVSRDLEELGAVKVRVPGGESVYAIPELAHERVAPEDHLRRMLSDWVADNPQSNPPSDSELNTLVPQVIANTTNTAASTSTAIRRR